MDLKLYGICFKMRGGPDLLDYVMTGDPIPVEVMGQIMEQMPSVTEDELKFARKLENDWKKALNGRVPLLMGVGPDGGYNIECEVPDNLLAAIRTLNKMSDAQIVKEYTYDYLKNVCGVDAEIIKVDVEQGAPAMMTAPAEGFDLSDLEEAYENPEELLEDPETVELEETPAKEALPEIFLDDDYEEAVPVEAVPMDEIPVEEPEEEDVYEEIPDLEEDEEIPDLEEDEEIPDLEEEIPETVEEIPETAEEEPQEVTNAVADIYKEMVSNIRARNLDERLNLRIGG